MENLAYGGNSLHDRTTSCCFARGKGVMKKLLDRLQVYECFQSRQKSLGLATFPEFAFFSLDSQRLLFTVEASRLATWFRMSLGSF